MTTHRPNTPVGLQAELAAVQSKVGEVIAQGGSIGELAAQYTDLLAAYNRALMEANARAIDAAKADLLAIFKAAVEKSGLEELMGAKVNEIVYYVIEGKPFLEVNRKPSTPQRAVSGVMTPQTSFRHQRIGPKLLREHQTLPVTDHRLLSCVKGYFSAIGIPYQRPESFPAALFDPDGYFIIADEPSMRSNPYINVGKQINIPGGVHLIPGYRRCGHEHR